MSHSGWCSTNFSIYNISSAVLSSATRIYREFELTSSAEQTLGQNVLLIVCAMHLTDAEVTDLSTTTAWPWGNQTKRTQKSQVTNV